VIVIDMQCSQLARMRHHEDIARALGPRLELDGPVQPRPAQRSFVPLSRIAHLVRLPALLIPQVRSRRT
jgi:hypothetical protein